MCTECGHFVLNGVMACLHEAAIPMHRHQFLLIFYFENDGQISFKRIQPPIPKRSNTPCDATEFNHGELVAMGAVPVHYIRMRGVAFFLKHPSIAY